MWKTTDLCDEFEKGIANMPPIFSVFWEERTISRENCNGKSEG